MGLSQNLTARELARRTIARVSNPATVDYWQLLSILDKQDVQQPFTPNRVQRDFLANRTRRNLILKARQQGISTIIQADHFVTGITQTARIATLAHDDATTQKLRRMAHFFWVSLPDAYRPKRGLDNATTTTYPATGSEVMIATAGNMNAGRGGTYTRFHGSEVAFWKDAHSVMAGVLQGVPDGGIVDLESTPNGAQGWFYERCMEALDGNSDWSFHFYPWWLDAGYQLALAPGEVLDYADDEQALVDKHGLTLEQIKWRRAKQRELLHLFPQEYPENPVECFLRSGLGYMGDISHVYTAPPNVEPVESHRYVAGLDFGQQNDYTVLSIIDATTLKQVHLLRVNRESWADMRRKVRQACKVWNVKELHAEANSMGSTNIEALQTEFHADGYRCSVYAFKTTNASKTAAMASLRETLHDPNGLRLLEHLAQRHEMGALQAKQTMTGAWQIAAPDGEHDDIPIANMLAWHAVSNRRYRAQTW